MQDAFTFVIASLVDFYVITFVLRLVLAWVRADFRNPLAQFVLRVTNPLVIPARRFVPAVGGIDTATLVVLLVLQSLATAILVKIGCAGSADLGQIVVLSLIRLAHLVLRTYSLLLLVYVVMSWVSPGAYNPAVHLLSSIVEPLLAPLRRIIPPIAGLDLTPLFALLAIEFVNRAIPGGFQFANLVCAPF